MQQEHSSSDRIGAAILLAGLGIGAIGWIFFSWQHFATAAIAGIVIGGITTAVDPHR